MKTTKKTWIRIAAIFCLVIVSPSLSWGLPTELIILFDATKSMSPVIEENKKQTDCILGALSQNICVTVISISAETFTNPIKILDRQCIPPRQYLLDIKHLEVAQRIVNQWRVCSQSLKANSPKTDIIGGAFLSSMLFAQTPMGTEKILFFVSDMRHDLNYIDLERAEIIPPSFLDKIRAENLIARLPGVKIWVLAHSHGKTQKYFNSLHMFWEKYFNEAGASLMAFSPFLQIQDGLQISHPKLQNDLKTVRFSHNQIYRDK